jgi:hypothetical protein
VELPLGVCQKHTRTQEHALISEGSTREIPAILPKHVMHLHPSEGCKHAIPATLPKICPAVVPIAVHKVVLNYDPSDPLR